MHRCTICGKGLNTPQGLAGHLQNAHGVKGLPGPFKETAIRALSKPASDQALASKRYAESASASASASEAIYRTELDALEREEQRLRLAELKASLTQRRKDIEGRTWRNIGIALAIIGGLIYFLSGGDLGGFLGNLFGRRR